MGLNEPDLDLIGSFKKARALLDLVDCPSFGYVWDPERGCVHYTTAGTYRRVSRSAKTKELRNE